MQPIQQINPQTRPASAGLAFKTGLAFRPFFWLGAVFLLISFILWSAFWQGNMVVAPNGGMIWWHQHEMLFGFAAAIVAGFLLTAVQSWTGLPTLSGARLWALVGLWAAARFLNLFPSGVSAHLIMVVDILFLPMVALVMARLVIGAKRWRNLIFVPVLLIFTIANVGQHWGMLNQNADLVRQSSYLAVWVMVTLILVLGGRVIPFFTSRALNVTIAAPARWREQLVVVGALGMCLLLFISLFGVKVSPIWYSLVLILTVVLNLWRWTSWKLSHSWRQPLLWGLHLSYLFVIVGAFLWLLSEWQLIAVDYALHVLTIDGILAIILAMIARVSLGHTGRPIKALPGLSLALVAVLAAGLIRGPLLWLFPGLAMNAYQLSLLLCILAYAWFVLLYTRPLWSARIDGRPG